MSSISSATSIVRDLQTEIMGAQASTKKFRALQNIKAQIPGMQEGVKNISFYSRVASVINKIVKSENLLKNKEKM